MSTPNMFPSQEAIEAAFIANATLHRRDETALTLVAVIGINAEIARGGHSFRRATDPTFVPHFAARPRVLSAEIAALSAEFDELQLAAAALMPPYTRDPRDS